MKQTTNTKSAVFKVFTFVFFILSLSLLYVLVISSDSNKNTDTAGPVILGLWIMYAPAYVIYNIIRSINRLREQKYIKAVNELESGVMELKTKLDSKAKAEELIKEGQDLANTVNKTSYPDIFFNGFDKIIETYLELSKLEEYVPFAGRKPSDSATALEKQRASETSKFIARYEDRIETEVQQTYDMDKRKQLVDEFETTITLYMEKYELWKCNIDIEEALVKLRKHLKEDSSLDSVINGMTGIEFEHFCVELLLKNGFDSAYATQASNDYGVDVIATKDNVKYAIQCKLYSSHIGNKAVQEVSAGKEYYKCHVAVVMTNNYFTANAITLAQATNVLLWDRDKLRGMYGK